MKLRTDAEVAALGIILTEQQRAARFVCDECGRVFPVPLMARDCEASHGND